MLELKQKKKLSARDTTNKRRRGGSSSKKRTESRESKKRERRLRGRRNKISSTGTRPTCSLLNTLENNIRILSTLMIWINC